MLLLISFCLLAYLIGSISSAVIVSRLMHLPDPRSHGSNNPGATNVLRVGGKKAAIWTLFGDCIKGVIPVLVAMNINSTPEFVGPVMVSVFLGHLYPIFFKFKGGKGVATAIGAIFALSWLVGLWLVVTWFLMVFITRLSSFSALVAALCAPLYTMMIVGWEFAFPVLIMSLFLFWRHRSNIMRLLDGKEPKIGEMQQKGKKMNP